MSILFRVCVTCLIVAAGIAQPQSGFAQPGGWGPGGGGFDPSGFLDRLDRNGNGMIDTDEMQGPARFMIDRMARDNPNIDTSKPISLETIKKGFEKMREQWGGSDRGRGGRDDRDRDRDRDRDSERRAVDEAMQIEQLVLGFEPPIPADPVPGFGTVGELFAVRVTAADERTAAERMARYDRNKNGHLDKEEMQGGNWFGNPMDFDRNGDGRLSPSELAVRYARRRVAEEEVKQERKRSESNDRRDRKKTEADEDPFNGRKSYRRLPAEADSGLPGWFAERDQNRDGQVVMTEYTSQWNDRLIEDFFKFDMNRDGVITEAECHAAVRSGASQSSGSSTVAVASSSSRGSGASRESTPAEPTPSTSNAGGEADPKYVAYAKRIIDRSDKNKDGALTADERKDMLMDISGADGNRDGRITLEEYAIWMKARAEK
ncbi:MAG: EF-hand domain-containing protein [Pirellulaceae bacterium]